MKIVEPSVEIITAPNPLKRIELAGRVCYKSEDKITPDSARGFVERIITRGHTSVLEHSRVKVPDQSPASIQFHDCGSLVYGLCDRVKSSFEDYYSMNARDFFALGGTLDELATLENAEDYLTVRFVCDRGISHELVRHRVFSFSQESTRYVNYSGKGLEFIRPLPFDWAKDKTDSRNVSWIAAMYQTETAYEHMIERGCSPQEARSVLPNSLKTELVMTGTFEQWREMLNLRTAPAAHPQMRYLMSLLLNNPECPEILK